MTKLKAMASGAIVFCFSRLKHLLLWNKTKEELIMVTFTILALIILAIVILAVAFAGVGGLMFVAAFGDVIVCALILWFLYKLIVKRRK